jgi:hypothetical protein
MAYGFRLVSSRYDERRFWANARLTLTGGAKQKSSDQQVNIQFMVRKDREYGQHIGRQRKLARVCLRVTTGTSEVDTVR